MKRKSRVFKRLVVMILVLLLVTPLVACKGTDYKEAQKLYINGNYSAAKDIYLDIGDYKDSTEKVKSCDYMMAQEFFDDKMYEAAEAVYLSLGSYRDSEDLANECKYLAAIAYLDDKEYETAAEMFIELEGYKESKVYLESMSWYQLVSYLDENGKQEYKDSENDYKITMDVDDEVIVADYLTEGFGVGLYLVVRLTQGNKIAALGGKSEFALLAAKSEDKGTTEWDISKYKSGDDFSWDSYEWSANDRYGKPLKDEKACLLSSSGVRELGLSRLTDGMKKILSESGLDISMKDLGFDSY